MNNLMPDPSKGLRRIANCLQHSPLDATGKLQSLKLLLGISSFLNVPHDVILCFVCM